MNGGCVETSAKPAGPAIILARGKFEDRPMSPNFIPTLIAVQVAGLVVEGNLLL